MCQSGIFMERQKKKEGGMGGVGVGVQALHLEGQKLLPSGVSCPSPHWVSETGNYKTPPYCLTEDYWLGK